MWVKHHQTKTKCWATIIEKQDVPDRSQELQLRQRNLCFQMAGSLFSKDRQNLLILHSTLISLLDLASFLSGHKDQAKLINVEIIVQPRVCINFYQNFYRLKFFTKSTHHSGTQGVQDKVPCKTELENL